MADDQAGFEIAGVFYPFPDSYTIGDSVLVRMLTGMDMEEFGELLADSEGATSDPRLLIGLIGVAVWHKHPRWSVDRAARFVQQTDLDQLGFPESDEEGDAVPPAPEGSASPVSESEPDAGSPEPAEPSNDEPASDSDVQSPSPSGALA